MVCKINRFKKANLVGALLTIALVDCASNPDQIGAANVSPLKYKDYDYNQLRIEVEHVGQQITNLYRKLKDKEESDEMQMGIALFVF